jgi:membrane protease YdiL (CAAX protease family)
MQIQKHRYYPSTLEAIHLLVLFIFLQSLIDFPLALYDYHKDTNWLSNPWINFISSFSITAFIFIYGYHKSQNKFSSVFALKTFNPLLILPIVILLPGLQYLVGLLNVEVDKILPAPPWFWELFERIFENRFGFWGAALKIVIIAPIVEEVLFRGIIMHGLMRNYRSEYAIFLSGLLFSLFHLNPWQMTYTFFLGLFLGWLMIRTRSLPLTILAHSINNVLVLLSIKFHKEISENALYWLPQSTNIKISIFALLIGIILIIAFTLKKRVNKEAKIQQE